MVKLDRFEIILNNPEHVYFAGQEISGKVSNLLSPFKRLQSNSILDSYRNK